MRTKLHFVIQPWSPCWWASGGHKNREPSTGYTPATRACNSLIQRTSTPAAVYRPGPDGGNMQRHHPGEAAGYTLAMTGRRSGMPHRGIRRSGAVSSTVAARARDQHDLRMPSAPNRPMVLLIHDERTPDRAILQGIGAILGKGGARAFRFSQRRRYHLSQLVVRRELRAA